MMDKSVPGYRIWKDQWGCTPCSWRWAKDGFEDKGYAGQNHGGASSREGAVQGAILHKRALKNAKDQEK